MKKASFYCDNCGSLVAANATNCPTCGRHFSAIKCPKCEYTGALREFAEGCPICGYMAPEMNPIQGEDKPPGQVKKKKPPRIVLPGWVMGVLSLILIGLLGFIIVNLLVIIYSE